MFGATMMRPNQYYPHIWLGKMVKSIFLIVLKMDHETIREKIMKLMMIAIEVEGDSNLT